MFSKRAPNRPKSWIPVRRKDFQAEIESANTINKYVVTDKYVVGNSKKKSKWETCKDIFLFFTGKKAVAPELK